jgi:hypothetical protein
MITLVRNKTLVTGMLTTETRLVAICMRVGAQGNLARVCPAQRLTISTDSGGGQGQDRTADLPLFREGNGGDGRSGAFGRWHYR